MEPLFPALLFLGTFFAPLIIRIGLALIFLWDAIRLAKGGTREKAQAIVALILAILVGVGSFTQGIAIVGIVYIFVMLFTRSERSVFTQKTTVLLTFFMLLSLIVTGAGYTPFPFGDLPY